MHLEVAEGILSRSTGTAIDQSELPGPLRTVTSDIGMHPNSEMNVIGLLIFAGVFVLALPLLPLLVIGWVVVKITSRQNGD